MSFHELDLDNYPRKDHLQYFSSLQYPYVGVTCNVDVTDLVNFCKEKKYSFFLTFLHIVAHSANNVKELRHRLRNGKVLEYDVCPTSHTELREDGTYCYCTLHHNKELKEYIPYAEKVRKQCRQNGNIEEDDTAESMFFISSTPWLHFTSLVQPTAGGDDSNPRIIWGKWQEDFKGRKQMPVAIQVHHGLLDGLHLAHFYQNISDEIKATIDDSVRS